MSFGDIVIDIFYEPQLFNHENDKFEEKEILKLKNLTKKYDKSFWSKANRIMFTNCYLKLYSNYYPWTSSYKIEKKIEYGLKIINECNLNQLSIRENNNPEMKILKEKYDFYPNMQHLWDYVEDIEKENKK